MLWPARSTPNWRVPSSSLAAPAAGSTWSGRLGTEPERTGHDVACFHLAGQREHVATFLAGDGDRVLSQGPGDLLQGQAVLAHVDEVVQELCLLAFEPPAAVGSSSGPADAPAAPDRRWFADGSCSALARSERKSSGLGDASSAVTPQDTS